jgi:hypothetical protein
MSQTLERRTPLLDEDAELKFDTISTVWSDLAKDARIVILTEPGRLALAEQIRADNQPLVSDIALVDIQAGGYEERIRALSERDLLIVMLTMNGFVGKNYRNTFSPFAKPPGTRAKYIFIRLDIPETALRSGLNTDLARVERIIAGLQPLQGGRQVRVTTAKGMDIVTCIKQQEILPYHARDLGGNAFLPPAEVSEELAEGSANGTIVVDVTVGEFRVNGELVDALGLVDEPVVIRVEEGRVKEVRGGSMAGRLRSCFARLPGNLHRVVELGHGLSDIEPTGIIGVDESMNGTCHIGIGNRDPYHLDLVIRDPLITVL